jgi:hypothetical protein
VERRWFGRGPVATLGRLHQPADAGPFAWGAAAPPNLEYGAVRRFPMRWEVAWGGEAGLPHGTTWVGLRTSVSRGTLKRSPTGFRDHLGPEPRVAAAQQPGAMEEFPYRERPGGWCSRWVRSIAGWAMGATGAGRVGLSTGASTSQLTLGRSPES